MKQGISLLPVGALERIERQGPRECLPKSLQSALGLPCIPKSQAPSGADYADASESSEVLSYYYHVLDDMELSLLPKKLPDESHLRFGAVLDWMKETSAQTALCYSFDHYFTLRTDCDDRLVVYDHLQADSALLTDAKASTITQLYAVVDKVRSVDREAGSVIDLEQQLGNDLAAAAHSN